MVIIMILMMRIMIIVEMMMKGDLLSWISDIRDSRPS